jgi:hypothetical protein
MKEPETGYLTELVRDLLLSRGWMRAHEIAQRLGKPLECVRWLLYCRRGFVRDEVTKKWGVRQS